MTDAADLLRRVAGEEGLAALRPAQQQVALGEQAVAQHRGGEALEALAAASEYMAELNPILERLAAAEQQLATAWEALPAVEQQGYRTEAARQAIQIGRERLRDTALAIARDGAQAAEDPLVAAETAARRAIRLGPQIATLQEDTQRRIDALHKTLAELTERVVEERANFEQVRRYNPASWSDIRGNGSEAEAALTQARALLESAATRNTREQQNFAAAEADVTAAEQRLTYATTLLQAIADRLAHLQEAERLTGEELAEAAQDIEAGWRFIRSYDPDIGRVPEDLLRQAEELLRRAREASAQPQPDWLAALQSAQKANMLADQALAGARDEHSAMEKRRHEVERAEAAAVAEAHKIGNFAQLHRRDISPEHYRRLQTLLASIKQAVALAEQAEQAEEEQRARLLDQSLQRLTAVTEEAEQIYAMLYGDFQSMERLRREVSAAVETAQQSIANAAAWSNQYAAILPASAQGVRLLEEARRTLRPFDARADTDTLSAIRNAAVAANDLAHQAVEHMRDEVERQRVRYPHRRFDADVGDVMTGAMIGMMLNNMFGGQRHYGGWGGGWGGGGSFGDYGGGAESFGDWSGGGGGAESFGDWSGGGGGAESFGDWGGGGGGADSFGDW